MTGQAAMSVQVKGLSVRRSGHTVVDGIDLDVPRGTVLGLIGPNGSGKSTLLRAIVGLTPTTAGTVTLDGTDIAALSRGQMARRVAVMAQESPGEFDLAALDMVLLGRIAHGRGFGRDSTVDVVKASEALKRAGVLHLARRSFSALSGGERQRVLLARALTQETPVLVLDEPTNHLDIANRLEILDLVRQNSGTVLVALHDLDLVESVCDHVAVLANGRLVAHGTPADVLNVELLRSVFDVEATPIAHPSTGRRHFLFDARANPKGDISG